MNTTKATVNNLVYQVIRAAIEVHKVPGYGLLEIVHHKWMEEKLQQKNIAFESEKKVPVRSKNKTIITDPRCDLFIKTLLSLNLKLLKTSFPFMKLKYLPT